MTEEKADHDQAQGDRIAMLESALRDCVRHLKVREIAPEKLKQSNAWWAIEVLNTIDKAEELIGEVK